MSNHFPSAADLAPGTLATNPHSTLHGDLGDTLSDFIDTLGKVDLTGYNSNPTLFDPASTTYDDGAWWQVRFTPGTVVFQLGALEDASASYLIFNFFDNGTQLGTTFDQFGASDATTEWAELTTGARISHDGTGRTASLYIASDLSPSGATLEATDTHLQLTMVGYAGQTDPLVDLQASDATSIVEVTGDKKIGFYNHAPVAQQTGVAVNAAGIHAALVNLGLITA